MKKIVFLLLIMIIACKNNAQNSDNTNTNKKELTKLPNELANKTWVYISNELNESYEDILEYSNKAQAANLVTTTYNITLSIDEQNTSTTYDIKKINKIDNGYFIETDDGGTTIEFSWVDENKNIAKWKINIPNYYDQDSDFNEERVTTNKDFVTPSNFPKQNKIKESQIILEEEKSLKSLYSDIIIDLPLEGQFACDYKEEGDDYIFQGGKLSLSNKDFTIENGDNGTVESFNNRVVIELMEYLNVLCDIRQIKDNSNKYALFYNSFIDTKFSVEESNYYSKTQPIAVIEIINSNTLKKKWLGFYNRKTKQIENAEDIGWQDKYCTIIKKQK